ncbi:hypothetical protein LTR64_001432 [Lithohypha guttulata]|uniref:uncharacterized protein n=1 Tax=Lithohypha guttulata TaxID=1690604 RepID=UPI002DDDCCBF|nr:hypothetical protein LTR51_003626 [Lithohypha guttulata]
MPPSLEDISDLSSADEHTELNDGFNSPTSTRSSVTAKTASDESETIHISSTIAEESSTAGKPPRNPTRKQVTIDVPKLNFTARREPELDTRGSCILEKQFLDQHFASGGSCSHQPDWVKADLNSFRIYQKVQGEASLESLHNVSLYLHKTDKIFYFDGTLLYRKGVLEVKGLEISSLQIDNLGGTTHNLEPLHSSCTDVIYIQTPSSRIYNCYYLLKSPSAEYQAVYKQFVWLANFMKYVIDYLEFATAEAKNVTLSDFKHDFIRKLQDWHKNNVDFEQWHQMCGHITDLRRHITSPEFAAFIAGRADGLSDQHIAAHDLWKGIGQALVPDRYVPKIWSQTLVTPYAARCFLQSFPSWKRVMNEYSFWPVVDERLAQRQKLLGIGRNRSCSQQEHFEVVEGKSYSKATLLLQEAGVNRHQKFTSGYELPGRVVIARNHEDDCLSHTCSCPIQYALVLRYCRRTGLYIRWLSLPSRTICAGLDCGRNARHKLPYYSMGNELLYSDECTCSPISISDVIASHSISVDKDHAEPGHELFVYREFSLTRKAISVGLKRKSYKCPQHSRPLITFRPSYNTTDEGEGQMPRPARILSIFSGAGLLDAGIEEGSKHLFKTIYAADLLYEACLSIAANLKVGSCEVHHENVNTLWEMLAKGERPLPDVDLFLAGCPCQGFSSLNCHKDSDDSLRNCSLLVHTLSWVELLLPRMVLIENVPGMDRSTPSAAGQAVCHLVGLGYQTQLITINAADFGAATSRKRIFIIATAPGIELLTIPTATHGKERHQSSTVTASSVTTDLAAIENYTTLNSVQPDHIPAFNLKPIEVGIVKKIPRTVPKAGKVMGNLFSALPKLNKGELEYWYKRTDWQRKPNAGTLRRIHPNHPKTTITKTISYLDSKSNGSIHWSQDRVFSLEELRRWQGVPTQYILIGTRTQQAGLIGNSVAWASSTLLGRLLAEVWRESRHAYPSSDAAGTEDIIGGRKRLMDNLIHELTDSDNSDDFQVVDLDSEFESIKANFPVMVNVPLVRETAPKAVERRQYLVSVDIPASLSLRQISAQSLSCNSGDTKALTTPDIEGVADKGCHADGTTTNVDIGTDDELPELDVILTPSRSSSEMIEMSIETPTVRVSDEAVTHRWTGSRNGGSSRRRTYVADSQDDEEEDGSPLKRARFCRANKELRASNVFETLSRRIRYTPRTGPRSLSGAIELTTPTRSEERVGTIISNAGSNPQTPIVLDDD